MCNLTTLYGKISFGTTVTTHSHSLASIEEIIHLQRYN